LTTAVAAIEEKTQPKDFALGLDAEPAEQRSVTLTGGTLNITGGFITAEGTASPRSDVVDFLVSDDTAVQLAALRIAIERELRGAAELAHLPAAPATRPLPLRRLMTELVRYELLPDDLAMPLARVIDVANRAIHGAPARCR
jgi:hypothetical protein